MFCAFLDKPLFPFLTILTILLLSNPAHVSAALQNATVDDQDFSKISYINPLDWSHDPLIGWEYQFFNGSRSYTWIPGASASLTFTGSGVYLQGPPAPDQAQRRVFLDGRDMGAYNLKAPDREYCTVFFSATGLPYTTHTIIVAHNDTPAMIFAMDAWFVEFDPSQSILPFSTTTTTTTAATQTITTIPTGINGINGTISGSPNTPDSNAESPKSYSTIIIAIVVPTLFFLLICIGGICIYRRRRTRQAHRRKESFREKFFRRSGATQLSSPLAPLFGKQAEGTGLGLGAAGRGRDSDDSRAMSPNTFASTRYSTALDHEYNSDQDHTRAQLSPVSPVPPVFIPANILDPRVLSEAMSNPNSSSTSLVGGGGANISPNRNSIRPIPATFDPPSEWRTTLSSSGPTSPLSPNAEAHPHADNHTHTHTSTTTAGAAGIGGLTGLSERTPRRTSTDAYRGFGSNPRLAPSTVFSETESAYSVGLGAPPARHYHHHQQHQQYHQDGRTTTTMRDAAASASASADRELPQGEAEFGSPPASPTRSNSVLRRFSTAITSSLPFTRSSSRPNSRHSNSLAMSTTHTGSNSANNNNNNRDGTNGHNTTQSGEDPESNGGRGYFHGMNHLNLGITLNYRPTASASPATHARASSPTTASPTQGAPSTRLGRPSVNSNGLGSDDVNRATSMSTAPGSPMDDAAFSSYTRQTRERVLGYRDGDTAAVGRDSNSGTHSTPPVPPVSSLNSSDGGRVGKDDVMEPEEKEDKEDKIVEALDGETIHEEADDEGQWSVDHGTLASNGGASVGADGVTRNSSLGRQRSVRSTADQGRAVIPPPYSVYIPPDTKPSPPPPPGSQ